MHYMHIALLLFTYNDNQEIESELFGTYIIFLKFVMKGS